MGNTTLTTRPVEEGTFIINAAYTDEDGNAVTPQTMAWTLTDIDGNVINSRSAVDLSPMATSHNVVLKGDDLAIQDAADNGRRIVTFVGTYNSITYGNGLGLNAECHFRIERLKNVS